jgi:hypothetical protein
MTLQTKARRALEKLKCVKNYEGLSNDERIRFNLNASILGVLAYEAGSNGMKKNGGEIEQIGKKLSNIGIV